VTATFKLEDNRKIKPTTERDSGSELARAALPPEVRKGSALPEQVYGIRGYASDVGLSLFGEP
jgi:hypothetical protein